LRLFVKYLFLFFICLGLSPAQGQNETKKWYFGANTGLNFLSVPPATLAGSSMSTPEGCASIADINGNLLFYTNGMTIWDRNHAVMANGTGLLGHNSSSQSSLILPLPGSTTLYYVFTNVGNNVFNLPNLNYSIVDITLSAGNGSVTTKNAMLSADPHTEMLTATRHCNGVDWWIVSHLRNSTVFLSFLLTSTGITGNSVLSFAGPTLLSGFSQMKLSPNGRKLAMNVGGSVYLGEFDNATGQTYGFNSLQNSSLGYGCEFSPDGGKLYTSAVNGIYQFNLCAGSLPAILSSSVAVYSQNAAFGSFQLASNGKIYITYNTSTTSCHVINSPNNSGTACGFTTGAHQFLPTSIQAGLPNFPGCYFYQKAAPNPFFVSVSSSYGCYGAMFDATILSGTCTAVTNSISGYTWDFGDPLSGLNNVGYTSNQVHNFSGNGTFTVTLFVYHACGVGTDTIRQPVIINDQCLTYTNSAASCASLGSASITSAAGVGPFTYTWLPGNQTGTVATGLTPGSHTVVVKDAWANYTYSVPIYLQPVAPYTSNINVVNGPVCFGGTNGSASITAISGGSGNQSYLWNNGTQLISQQNPTNLSAGMWSVSVTDLLSACQVNSVINIPQPAPVTPTITASSPSACCNNSVLLTCIASGGTPAYTFSWTPLSGSATKVVSEVIAGPFSYSVQIWDANNCTGSQSISITFVNGPTLTVTDVSVCPGKTATLQVSGASSYTWLSSSTASLAGSVFTVTPASSSVYDVTGSAFGCTSSATASVFLYPQPISIIQSNSPLCEGNTFYINASGAATYTWTGPSNFNSSASSNTISAISLAQAGIYTVYILSAQGCSNNATTVLAVNPIPTVAVTGGTICSSQNLQLGANSSGSANFQWSGPAGYLSSLQNPILQSPAISGSGIYTVTVSSAAGCTNSAFANVQIISPPVLNLARSSVSICSQNYNGSVNTLTISPAGALLYTLQTSPQFSTTSFFPDFSLKPLTLFNNNTIGSGTLVGTNGVCSSIKVFTFLIVPSPVISLLSNTPAICAGDNATLTANGATSYTWLPFFNNSQIINNGSGQIVKPTALTNYSVIGFDKGCYSPTSFVSLQVKALPVFTVSPISSTVCQSTRLVLNAEGFGNTFSWSPSNSFNTGLGNQVVTFPMTNQVYTVTAFNSGCGASKTLSVNVLPLPLPQISLPKRKFCVNDSIVLSGSGGQEYFWYSSGGAFQKGDRVKFFPQTLTAFQTFTLLVSGLNACTNSTTETVEIMKLPEGDFENFPQHLCIPKCVSFSFAPYSKNTVSEFWIEGNFFSGNYFSYCFKKTDSFRIAVMMRDSVTSCAAKAQYTITTFPKPLSNFSFSPLSPVENKDEVLFTNKSQGEDLSSFEWFFSDTKTFSLKEKDAEHLFTSPGNFEVALVVRNKFMCSDTSVKSVNVSADLSMYIPNTFTPDGDDKNEIFKPVLQSVKFYSFKIYNRWGTEVFSATELEEGWNGFYRGHASPSDSYIWVIEITSATNEKKNYTGTVLLLR